MRLLSTEKAVEEPEEPPPEPTGPPEPEPGSDEWEYVDQPIDKVGTPALLWSVRQPRDHMLICIRSHKGLTLETSSLVPFTASITLINT